MSQFQNLALCGNCEDPASVEVGAGFFLCEDCAETLIDSVAPTLSGPGAGAAVIGLFPLQAVTAATSLEETLCARAGVPISKYSRMLRTVAASDIAPSISSSSGIENPFPAEATW